MANENFANNFLVEVEGSPLPADIVPMLTAGYVDDSRAVVPDMFVLRFSDPNRVVLEKARFKIGAKVKIKVKTSDPEGPTLLISGEVTALETEIDRLGAVTEVRGLDHSHRLFRGRRVAAYPNLAIQDIVKKVAQRAKLQVGKVSAVPGVGGNSEDQISQENISDWEFLCRLADMVGAHLSVVEEKLNFELPEAPSGAPNPSQDATKDPLVLEAGKTLTHLRAGMTAAEQVPEVQVRGWDFENKKELEHTEKPKAEGTEVSEDPVELAGLFAAPPYLAADSTLRTQGEVKAVAKALATDMGGAFVEIEGVARGNPKLRAGVQVALGGVGKPWEGKYTLTSTRHQFTPDQGYTTAFTISSKQERSLYGITSGRQGGIDDTLTGSIVPGIVSDVKDPKKLGRVKLTFPWMSKEFVTTWARTLQPGAGKDRGMVILPEVGDEVLVAFERGDIDSPYVLGGLHNGQDKIPTLDTEPVDSSSGEINVRAFVSRTGHRMEFLEAAGKAEGILISTGDKKFIIRLDQKNKTIEITSDDKIKVTGKDIKVKSTGPLALEGKTVSVKSDTSLDMEGLTTTVNGKTSATFKGATTNVEGTALTVVKGGIVKIN